MSRGASIFIFMLLPGTGCYDFPCHIITSFGRMLDTFLTYGFP